MTKPDTTSASATSLDRLIQSWQAHFTGGLSPASLMLAYMDWLVHLSNSPGKQSLLIEKAWRDALQLAAYAAQSTDSQTAPLVEPRPLDKRFTALANGG